MINTKGLNTTSEIQVLSTASSIYIDMYLILHVYD